MSSKRKVLKEVIGWLVTIGFIGALFAVAVMTGVRVSPILSNSMEPTFVAGDAAVYVSTDIIPPAEGDIIVFTASVAGNEPMGIVHRWIGTEVDGTLITQGDNNTRPDPWRITSSDITGTYVTALPTHLLRNPYTIPVSGSVLVFVIIGLIALNYVKPNTDETENEEPIKPVKQDRNINGDKAVAIDWYSGGEDIPNSPPRYPWLEPLTLKETNTFHDMVNTKPLPKPVIPEGWTPKNIPLPPDPIDIYWAKSTESPVRPVRHSD